MKRLVLLAAMVGLALAPRASAQGFNIDVGSTYGTPTAGFAAGGAQAGTWNPVAGIQGTYPLVSLAGAPTGATITCVGSGSYEFSSNNGGTSGDDQALMDDGSDPTSAGATWTINGVAPGNYVLYTYAWAPDSASFLSLVSVTGSTDPAQTVGGAWPGTYVQGVTHARHHITILPGGSVGMSISVSLSFATLNGFQLAQDTPGTHLCDPGSGAVQQCPCGNPSNGPGLGCDNSDFTGGASITATGVPNLAADTLMLTTAGQLATATSIVAQGSVLIPSGVDFGQGVRCVGGTLLRLYVLGAAGGSIRVPPPGGPSVSARSATLGDTITGGSSRYYFVYYRDPLVLGPCPSTSTFNCTTTLEMPWQ